MNTNLEFVDVYELWVPCNEKQGQAVRADGSHMKLAAQIVNGHVVYLAKDYFLEKRKLTKVESEQITSAPYAG